MSGQPTTNEPPVQDIYRCLEQIIDPCSASSASPMNLVEMGLIREVSIDVIGVVTVQLRLTAPSCFMVGTMTKQAKQLIGRLPGVREVTVISDAGLEWTPDLIAPETAERRRRQLAARPTAAQRS